MDTTKLFKRALTLTDLLLLVAAAYLVVQMVYSGGDAAPDAAVPVSPVSGRTAEPVFSSGVDSRVILERNLFGSRTSAAAPQPEAVNVDDLEGLPDSTVPFTLLGTVVQAGGKSSFAVMQENSTREQSIYHVGDELTAGAYLVSVGRNRVVINRDGQEEILEKGADEQARTRSEKVRPRTTLRRSKSVVQNSPGGDITVRKVGDNSYVLDKREVEAVMQDFNKLLTQVRIVPHFADGKPDGFKVFNIRPNSLFAKLGMVNGDIIRRINGLDITGPEQALQMFQQLREESRIALDMERFRKNLTLQYEIR
jgi:general secretion pathway protein C